MKSTIALLFLCVLVGDSLAMICRSCDKSACPPVKCEKGRIKESTCHCCPYCWPMYDEGERCEGYSRYMPSRGDCAPGTQCLRVKPLQRGTCQKIGSKRYRASLDEPCLDTFDCTEGLRCSTYRKQPANFRTCVKIGTKRRGDVCENRRECKWGLRCKLDKTTSERRCVY